MVFPPCQISPAPIQNPVKLIFFLHFWWTFQTLRIWWCEKRVKRKIYKNYLHQTMFFTAHYECMKIKGNNTKNKTKKWRYIFGCWRISVRIVQNDDWKCQLNGSDELFSYRELNFFLIFTRKNEFAKWQKFNANRQKIVCLSASVWECQSAIKVCRNSNLEGFV